MLAEDLRVMDATAVAFCKENGMPILVLDIAAAGVLMDAVQGQAQGTLVS